MILFVVVLIVLINPIISKAQNRHFWQVLGFSKRLLPGLLAGGPLESPLDDSGLEAFQSPPPRGEGGSASPSARPAQKKLRTS